MFRIDRRAGAPALLVALVVLAGCGGPSQGKTTFQDPNPLPVDTMTMVTDQIGTHGGRFVIGQTSPPKTFNGIMANETTTSDVTQLLFTTLADYNNGTQRETPMLAKRYEVAADGVTWTWHLRRGARFSDGHPITSEDVLFSFKVAYDDKVHPSIQDLLKPGGKPLEVSAPDSYTVITKSAVPYAMMVASVGSLRIMPKHILEGVYERGEFAAAYNTSTAPESLVTSGPWMLKSFVPGEKTVLTRNPHSFRVDAKGQRLPYLDELVFSIVPDQEAAALKFQAGEIDAVDNVRPEDYQAYADRQEMENYTLHELGPSMSTNFFWFNLNTVKPGQKGKGPVGSPRVGATKYAWFSNRDFRRAVSMAIDREAIIKSVLFGDAVKNWSTTTAGNQAWHTPSITGPDYNPDEARRLLAGLGWKDKDGDGILEDTKGNPISFTMKTNGDNKMRMGIVGFIKDDLAKVGIRCVPSGMEFNTLISNIREDFQYESILLGLQTGVPPDPGMGQNVWRSTGPTHYWNIKQVRPESAEEARIDALMDSCVGTYDIARRKAAWEDIQRIVNDQTWFIWLPTIEIKIPVRNKFGNVQPVIIPHRVLWNIDRVFVKSGTGPA